MYHGSAIFDGGHADSDALSGVVVGMDSDLCIGEGLCDIGDDLCDFMSKRSAVGIAKNDPFCPAFYGMTESIEGVFFIVFESVEEVFCVEEGFGYVLLGVVERVFDGVEVIVRICGECVFDLLE